MDEFDPVQVIDDFLTTQAGPALGEIRNTIKFTASRPLLQIYFGASTYDQLVSDIPNTEQGGIHAYAQRAKLSESKEIGLHVALLEAVITDHPDIAKQREKAVQLILGQPVNPENPDSIHFPMLISAIDLLPTIPQKIADKGMVKPNVKHAISVNPHDPSDITPEKAMVVVGVMWKDLTPHERMFVLEDIINLARYAFKNLPQKRPTEPAALDNKGIAAVLHYGLCEHLLPLIVKEPNCYEEISDTMVEIAKRMSSEPRGTTDAAIDLSLRGVTLLNLSFVLQTIQIKHDISALEYPDPQESIRYALSRCQTEFGDVSQIRGLSQLTPGDH